jgi:Transport protein Trs120 or TRAPPC9, TRAPP II complex subunit
MSNVWVKQSLESHAQVQVLLVPLGGIPKVIFERYCAMFKQIGTVPMQELTAPGEWTRQNCPFRHFSWTQGSFRFQFVREGTTDGGLSEWGDIQAHRRVYAVLGIVHEPSCTPNEDGSAGQDLALLQSELALAAAPYPHATLQRIFVFEHSFEAGSMTGYSPMRDVILPPEPPGEGGAELLLRFLCEPLHNVAVLLIGQIESWVRSYAATLSGGVAGKVAQMAAAATRGLKPEPLPPLRSPLDRDEDSAAATALTAANGSSSAAAAAGKSDKARAKRRWARLRKWVGDLCLLAGSPKDAIELYDAAASELAKGDPLWHAGALEGFAACLVALADVDSPSAIPPEIFKLVAGREQDGSSSSSSSSSTTASKLLSNSINGGGGGGASGSSTFSQVMRRGVVERCQEALRRLSEAPVLAPLELELCFKLARYYAAECSSSSFSSSSSSSSQHHRATAAAAAAAAAAAGGAPESAESRAVRLGRADTLGACDEALACLMRALGVPDMRLQTQIERSVEAAALCEGMGLRRKAALFTHLAALLCGECENWHTAHELGRIAAQGYGVQVRLCLNIGQLTVVSPAV